jgi:hypothetical protein
MMRDSASAGAKSVWLALGPQGAAVRWRAEAGQASQQRALPPASRWLRLKREGDQFSSYTSRNGRHWQLLDRATLDMGPTILAGLALAAQTESGVDLLPASTRSANAAAECRFDYVNAGHHLRFHSFVPRIELKGGSELSGDIPSADGRTVVYNSPLGLLTVDQRHIERIDFYWITPTLEKRLEPGRPGVLLANGEFVEGEFKGLKDGMCTISSVLFGLRRFDTANEVLSIVFSRNPTPPSEPEFEVHTWAGSIWRGRIQSMNASGVILVDPILGRQSVAYFELKELTRQPGS